LITLFRLFFHASLFYLLDGGLLSGKLCISIDDYTDSVTDTFNKSCGALVFSQSIWPEVGWQQVPADRTGVQYSSLTSIKPGDRIEFLLQPNPDWRNAGIPTTAGIHICYLNIAQAEPSFCPANKVLF